MATVPILEHDRPQAALVPTWMPAGDLTKIVAVVLMLTDHIGAVFAPHDPTWRIIGRAAFPLFSCLLAVGMLRTRNRSQYIMRLFIFAAVSQWPFHFIFKTSINIGFTLGLAALGIALCETLRHRWGAKSIIPGMAAVGVVAAIGHFARVDFGFMGVLLPIAIVYARSLTTGCLMMGAFLVGYGLFTNWAPSVLGVVITIPLVMLLSFTDTKEPLRSWRVVPRWGFYLIYPAHLLAIALISGRIHL